MNNLNIMNNLDKLIKLKNNINNLKNDINNLKEIIIWSITKPDKIIKKENITIYEQRKQRENEERKWGNKMIKKINNGQWSTKLGEYLIYDILILLGENPKRPLKKNGYIPDWETDKYIYEVKTSNWWVKGTAGEKVLGTAIKYQNIPEIYKKPLKIVCIANQEDELTNGKTVFFGKNITDKTKKVLELYKSWDIEYIPFSKLLNDLLISISIENIKNLSIE